MNDDHDDPGFGIPRYPATFEPQPSPRSRHRAPRLIVLGLLVVAALAAGGYALLSSEPEPSGTAAASHPSRVGSAGELPSASVATPVATSFGATATAASGPPDAVPTDGGAAGSSCPSAADAEIPAFIFVGALALEQAQDAQDCVYPGTVDPATTAALSGRAFEKQADTHSDTGAGGTFTFTEVGGHGTLKVTTTKEADGRYYVTAVGLH